MLAYDAHGVVESKPEALPRSFGSEERFEDPVLKFRGNARAGVPDLDKHHFAFQAAGQFELSPMAGLCQGVQGVLDEAVHTWLSSLP